MNNLLKKTIALLLLFTTLFSCTMVYADDEKTSKWKIENHVDEFNLPTDEKYLAGLTINGIFSNSATTDSDLSAAIFLEKYDEEPGFLFILALLEYREHYVSNSSSKNEVWYDILVMDKNKTKHTLEGGMVPKGNTLLFPSDDDARLDKILREGGTVYFLIKNQEDSSNYYVFSIEADEYADLADELIENNWK